MLNRRIAALAGVVAIAAAACTPGGQHGPQRGDGDHGAGQRAGQRGSRPVHRRRLVEQLPAAALGGQGPAQHAEGRHRRRRPLPRLRREPQQHAAADRRRTPSSTRVPTSSSSSRRTTRPAPRWSSWRPRATSRSSPTTASSRIRASSTCPSTTRTSASPRPTAMLKKVPPGTRKAANYVLIKGDPGDAERQDLPARGLGQGRPQGRRRCRRRSRSSADGTFTDAWDTDQGPEQHGSDHRHGQPER